MIKIIQTSGWMGGGGDLVSRKSRNLGKVMGKNVVDPRHVSLGAAEKSARGGAGSWGNLGGSGGRVVCTLLVSAFVGCCCRTWEGSCGVRSCASLMYTTYGLPAVGGVLA